MKTLHALARVISVQAQDRERIGAGQPYLVEAVHAGSTVAFVTDDPPKAGDEVTLTIEWRAA